MWLCVIILNVMYLIPTTFFSNENCVEKQSYAESHIRTADKAIVDQHSHTCKLLTVVYVISIK